MKSLFRSFRNRGSIPDAAPLAKPARAAAKDRILSTQDEAGLAEATLPERQAPISVAPAGINSGADLRGHGQQRTRSVRYSNRTDDELLATGTDNGRTVVPMHAVQQRTVAASAYGSSTRQAGRQVHVTGSVPQDVGANDEPSSRTVHAGFLFKGTPKRVESLKELKAAIAVPWKGILSGIVAADFARTCVPLDLTCADVGLVVTEEMLTSPHYASVRRAIEQQWLFRIKHVIVAPADLVGDLHQRCCADVANGELRSIDEKNRLVTVYDDIVVAAIKASASDIHFETAHDRGAVRLRVYGIYRPWRELDPRLILDSLSAAFGSRIKTKTNSKEQFSSEVSVNFMTSQRVDGRQWDGRYNGRPHATGYKSVLRLLESSVKRDSIPTFEGLGYNKSHQSMLTAAMQRKWGLLLISGPTGSGKSTTLRTCMVHVPNAESLARYTVESPVEYEMPGIVQFSQPVDVHQTSEEMSREFTALLRDVVRMDPDMLMVGEIRDKETAKLIVEFTTSGHRSASSLHGGGCIDVLSRACGPEIAIPSEILGGAKFINASIYQRLLPVLCPHCRIGATDPKRGLSHSKREILRTKFQLDPGTMFVANPSGCPHCAPTVIGLAPNGTKGVVAAAEILMPDARMRDFIAARNWTALESAWRGMRTADFGSEDMVGKTAFEHGLWLASQGRVSVLDLEAEFEALEDYELFAGASMGATA